VHATFGICEVLTFFEEEDDSKKKKMKKMKKKMKMIVVELPMHMEAPGQWRGLVCR
jgi:hypothetical protein